MRRGRKVKDTRSHKHSTVCVHASSVRVQGKCVKTTRALLPQQTFLSVNKYSDLQNVKIKHKESVNMVNESITGYTAAAFKHASAIFVLSNVLIIHLIQMTEREKVIIY